MRGRVGDLFFIAYTLRITPAYAGKSVVTVVLYEPLGDHPRVCGEERPRG